jgi:hypothetical protein
MSSQEQRIRHSKRRANTQTHIKKQVKIARNAGLKVEEEHRFAKHHALDCGVPHCPLCDYNHTPKRLKTLQELKFIETEKY